MHLDVLAGFVAFGVVAAGPNNLMLMTSGVKFGFGRPHLAGVVLGFSLMVALVGLGAVAGCSGFYRGPSRAPLCPRGPLMAPPSPATFTTIDDWSGKSIRFDSYGREIG